MPERMSVQRCKKPELPMLSSEEDTMYGVDLVFYTCDDLDSMSKTPKPNQVNIYRTGVFPLELSCDYTGCRFHEDFKKEAPTS